MTGFSGPGDLSVLDAPGWNELASSTAATGAGDGGVRTLDPYELLFAAGDRRNQAYQIEEGAICVFRSRADGLRDVVEFAVRGDLVGLGCLDRHSDSAEAVGCAKVRPIPLNEVHDLALRDDRIRARFEQAIAREIEARRGEMVAAGQRAPMERVAALLTVISTNNRREGREPLLVPDALESGIVADMLDMSVASLASHLVELARRGLVEPSECGGLRLLDIGKLEELARRV